MARLTLQKPSDQPQGRSRLLQSIRAGLTDTRFNDFRIIVAFAKLGPLLRLESDIAAWRGAGKTIRAIIGVDQRGTSREALEFALRNFSETHIAHVLGPFTPTFHPKIYLFAGAQHAIAFVGSNNLTVGGTETNLESHIRVDMDLPADSAQHTEFQSCWNDALSISSRLDNAFLAQLVAAGLVVPEAQIRTFDAAIRSSPHSGLAPVPGAAGANPTFPAVTIVPPSPLPGPSRRAPSPRRAKPRVAAAAPLVTATAAPAIPTAITQALVIQIVPHHNGEIFLSKTAVDQDPAFFGWPFTGLTTPKVPGNPAYPQRLPDPVVDLRVYDATGALTIHLNPFNLNTVYYETKSEIRITVPQNVVAAVPALSIMVMRVSQTRDYDIDIHVPGSPQYNTYLAACNQTMPSGGSATPRRFGWL